MISTEDDQAASSSSFSTMRETSTEANNLAAVSTAPQTQPQSLTSIDSPPIPTQQQPSTNIGSTAPQTPQQTSTGINPTFHQTQPQLFTTIDSTAAQTPQQTSSSIGSTDPQTQQPPSTSMNPSAPRTQPHSFTSIDSPAIDTITNSLTTGNTVPPISSITFHSSEYSLKKRIKYMWMFHTTCNLLHVIYQAA